MKLCEFFPACGFFLKYNDKLNDLCQQFIMEYCQGDKGGKCERRRYFNMNGTMPEDDILPSGRMLPKELRIET